MLYTSRSFWSWDLRLFLPLLLTVVYFLSSQKVGASCTMSGHMQMCKFLRALLLKKMIMWSKILCWKWTSRWRKMMDFSLSLITARCMILHQNFRKVSIMPCNCLSCLCLWQMRSCMFLVGALMLDVAVQFSDLHFDWEFVLLILLNFFFPCA